jgi:hypothetical protein
VVALAFVWTVAVIVAFAKRDDKYAGVTLFLFFLLPLAVILDIAAIVWISNHTFAQSVTFWQGMAAAAVVILAGCAVILLMFFTCAIVADLR